MPSASLTLRNVKGSALTFTEMDDNLTNLAAAANLSATASNLTTLDANVGSYQAYANASFITSSLSANIDLNDNHIIDAVISNTKEKVVAHGNTTGAVSVNADQGPIQTYTLTGDIQLWSNNVSNLDSGQSVTLVLTQDATGSRLLSSDWAFAGASKTLTTDASAIDTITVTYDGTNYLAALVKGYA